MSPILSTVACNLDANLLMACHPLFEKEKVEAIEWSFDTLYKVEKVPDWFESLIRAYANENRLIGHGVFFSLFSGKWSTHQTEWLRQLKQLCSLYNFDHITEHFGFMTGSDFHHGAPLTIPYSAITLNIGRDRLSRIYDACHCPVGLENLAFSYSLEEVKQHGEFLEKLITPVNGFIIFDLHNLYCQLQNFPVAFDELINLYPLDKVREIHISGGSWEDSQLAAGKKIRRDTHDGTVPDDVFDLLSVIMPLCKNLKFVVLEQLGNSLHSDNDRQQFYNDFLRMENIVLSYNKTISDNINRENFLPLNNIVPKTIAEDQQLHQQQIELSAILENAVSCQEALILLQQSSLAQSDWNIESWQPYMIETAVNIARKWKK